MCGIAGILGSLTDGNQAALERMTDALGHRGPDGAGSWISSPDSRGFGCMLGLRRLSIIDLSHAADQPMTDCSGGHRRSLVFNGEIAVAPGQPARPQTRTGVPGLFLAGDWIDTGLPATIEGAALSGRRAAEALS